jgi:alpha-tubulin suppressor-like RCC1 family protein
VTIAGPGANVVAVSGNNTSRVFEVDSGVTANISGLTIENGQEALQGGGGILNNGALTLSNSALSNDVSGGGGGIANGGNLTIIDSTVVGNSALGVGDGDAGSGGGIGNQGNLTISNSTISGNTGLAGGGIFSLANFGANLTITNSTVVGNTATDGGDSGGGVYNGGDGGPGSAILTATIVAENSGGDCSAEITNGGFNIDDDGTCGFTGTSISDSSTLKATLGPLANNGGPSQTIALEPDNPAIGAVNSTSLCSTPDQRGMNRPTPCDIGAFQTTGTVVAWGDNIGNLPVQVMNSTNTGALTDATQISENGETTSLALLSNGTVMAWGVNSEGQLGNGTDAGGGGLPVQVVNVTDTGPLTDVKAVSAGFDYGLALLDDGTVVAWGDNGDGQLGDGTETGNACSTNWYVNPCNDTPVQVMNAAGTGPLTGVMAISAASQGWANNFALLENGTVVSWGANIDGDLGDGTDTGNSCSPASSNQYSCSDLPVQVVNTADTGPLTDVTAISGGATPLALLANGTVMAWGVANGGELGNGTDTGDSDVPVQVMNSTDTGPLSDVAAVSNGGDHSLALLANGTVMAWGDNAEGQLGVTDTNMDADLPVQVMNTTDTGPLTGVTDISAGEADSSALLADGTAMTWGFNESGELGDGTDSGNGCPNGLDVNACNDLPEQVMNASDTGPLTDITQISTGPYDTLALMASWQANQAITFMSTPPSAPYSGGPTYTVSASASSDLPVTLSIDASASSVCSISGGVVRFIGVGMCTIDANQAGNSVYGAARQAQQSFSVGPALQAITLTSTAPANATVGGSTYTISGTGGGSGNPVTFSIAGSSAQVCGVSGSIVTFIGAGTCTIDANQAGNATYMAAPQAQQSFSVAPPSRCAFVSAHKTSLRAGKALTFVVLTNVCSPWPTITGTSLPSWLTLTDYGDGYATLTATDPLHGKYHFTLVATNAAGTVKQKFVLTVKPSRH